MRCFSRSCYTQANPAAWKQSDGCLSSTALKNHTCWRSLVKICFVVTKFHYTMVSESPEALHTYRTYIRQLLFHACVTQADDCFSHHPEGLYADTTLSQGGSRPSRLLCLSLPLDQFRICSTSQTGSELKIKFVTSKDRHPTDVCETLTQTTAQKSIGP